MNSELLKKLWALSSHSQEPVNHCISKTLVIIGCSLVRKLEDTEVRSLSGAKMQDITVELEAIVSDDCKYKHVIILAGGNDASMLVENMNLEATMSAFNTSVIAARKCADDVAVAEIPPRFQPVHANDNIVALNANIMSVAAEQSISFIPNKKSFFLPSDDINDGYFYDKVHLTLKGPDKLAVSMGLQFRKNSDSCSSIHSQQTAPQTLPRPRAHPAPALLSRPCCRVKCPIWGTFNRSHGVSRNSSPSTRSHQNATGSDNRDILRYMNDGTLSRQQTVILTVPLSGVEHGKRPMYISKLIQWHQNNMITDIVRNVAKATMRQ